MPKRRRWNSWLWYPLLGIAAAAAAYVVLSAWLLSRHSYHSFHSFRDLLIPRLVDVIVVAWLFWVSSAIGSFLNVVAYRLPRGRGVGGFSACPYCASPIAARDNIPVFGWLALRGRCRKCHLPIAARYPIVELAVGLTLTAVGVMGLYLAGLNLPYSSVRPFSFGQLHMPSIGTPNFAIGVYHMTAVAACWALALVRFDGVRLPRTLVMVCLALVILPMLVWPPIQVVSWQVSVEPGWRAGGFLSAVLRVTTGLAAAALMARAIGRTLFPAADIKLDPLGKQTAQLLDLIAILAIPGIVVGWQALLSVILVACVIAMLLKSCMPGRDGAARLAVSVPVALSVQLAAWRWLDSLPYWPGTRTAPWVIIFAALAAALLTLWLKPRPVRPDPVKIAS